MMSQWPGLASPWGALPVPYLPDILYELILCLTCVLPLTPTQTASLTAPWQPCLGTEWSSRSLQDVALVPLVLGGRSVSRASQPLVLEGHSVCRASQTLVPEGRGVSWAS